MRVRVDRIIAREYNPLLNKYELFYRAKKFNGKYEYKRAFYASYKALYSVKTGDFINE